MREYPKALAKLEARYARIHGEFRQTSAKWTPPNDWEETSKRVAFFVDGASRRWTTFSADLTSTVCVMREFSFWATKIPKANLPVLRQSVRGMDDELASMIDNSLGETVGVPYSTGFPLSELFKLPDFQFSGVREVQRDGRRLLEWEARSFLAPQKQRLLVRTFVVAPDDGWILREFRSDNSGRTTLWTIDYGPAIDGIPTVRRIDKSSPREKVSIIVDRLEFGPSPVREFTLQAVGFAEQPTGTPKE